MGDRCYKLSLIPPALQQTPWGPAQSAWQYAEGLIFVTTAGHGGLWCSQDRWLDLINLFPSWQPFNGNQGWLEEDEDFALAPIVWPQFFEPAAVFNAVRTALHAAIGYKAPNDWQAVSAWLDSEAGAAVRRIAADYEATIAGQWERGSFSCGLKSPGYRVTFTRGPAGQTRTFKDYPLKQFYTQEEIDSLSIPDPPKPLNKRPAVYFDESAIGGAFDGFTVTSDADPGL